MNAITPATMMAVSASISSVGQVIQARGAAASAKINQQRYEQEKKAAELEGLQAELSRRKETEAILSNNMAVKGASGVGESRSFMAIQNDIQNILEQDLSSIRISTNKIQTNLDRAIFNEKNEAYYSGIGSIINASTTIIDGWAYHDYYLKEHEKPMKEKLKKFFRYRRNV